MLSVLLPGIEVIQHDLHEFTGQQQGEVVSGIDRQLPLRQGQGGWT